MNSLTGIRASVEWGPSFLSPGVASRLVVSQARGSVGPLLFTGSLLRVDLGEFAWPVGGLGQALGSVSQVRSASWVGSTQARRRRPGATHGGGSPCPASVHPGASSIDLDGVQDMLRNGALIGLKASDLDGGKARPAASCARSRPQAWFCRSRAPMVTRGTVKAMYDGFGLKYHG
jgi:hypothetical protein